MFTGIFKVSGKKKKKAVDTKGYVQLGEDGLFFERLDNAYLNSPTGTMCLLKFHEFCVPVGLMDAYQELWKKIENDYIRYGYYLLYVPYDVDANVRKEGVKYLNPKHYLVKDLDDNGNASSFLNVETKTVYPAFNSNQAVVKAQFEKDGYAKFKGQVYMYNDSSLPYRITPLYSALKSLELEADAETYVSKASDNAMFGNNIFVMKKSSDASDKEIAIIETVKDTLASVKGVEEAAQNLLLEYEGDIEDVTKLISKISISNDVNVDLLNAVDDKASKKICKACYGFPEILISNNDGLFGNSGEAIQTAEDIWAKTCQKEANNILDGFKKIGLTITQEAPVVEDLSATDEKTQEAQAVLKGSVGGVTSLLQVQASYSAGTTSLESAIAIFELLFGFSREDATRLLGNPKKETDGSTSDPNNTGA